MASDLVTLELDRLIVSLDGQPDVHNRVRGHPRSFQLASEGIARVVAERATGRRPFVQVCCAILVYNQTALAEFVETVAPCGVDQIALQGLIYATREQVEAQGLALRAAFGIERCEASVLDNGAYVGVDVGLLGRELATIRSGGWSNRVVVTPPGVEQHLEVYYALQGQPFREQRCTAIYRELWVLPNVMDHGGGRAGRNGPSEWRNSCGRNAAKPPADARFTSR